MNRKQEIGKNENEENEIREKTGNPILTLDVVETWIGKHGDTRGKKIKINTEREEINRKQEIGKEQQEINNKGNNEIHGWENKGQEKDKYENYEKRKRKQKIGKNMNEGKRNQRKNWKSDLDS